MKPIVLLLVLDNGDLSCRVVRPVPEAEHSSESGADG